MGNANSKTFDSKEIKKLKDDLNLLMIKLSFCYELKRLKDDKNIVDSILNESIASLETEIEQTNNEIEIETKKNNEQIDGIEDDGFATHFFY